MSNLTYRFIIINEYLLTTCPENLSLHCIEVRFASFPSRGFITMAVINPPEKKPANSTSVHCLSYNYLIAARQCNATDKCNKMA